MPPALEVFDLAVRAHSNDSPLLTSGEITLDLPGLPHANIGTDGEANFKGVGVRYKGLPIRVLARLTGYEELWLTPTVENDVLDVNLMKANPSSVLGGSLVPLGGKTTKVLVEGQEGETSPDEFGRFKINVSGKKAGDRVRIMVYRDGELVYDDYQVLPRTCDTQFGHSLTLVRERTGQRLMLPVLHDKNPRVCERNALSG